MRLNLLFYYRIIIVPAASELGWIRRALQKIHHPSPLSPPPFASLNQGPPILHLTLPESVPSLSPPSFSLTVSPVKQTTNSNCWRIFSYPLLPAKKLNGGNLLFFSCMCFFPLHTIRSLFVFCCCLFFLKGVLKTLASLRFYHQLWNPSAALNTAPPGGSLVRRMDYLTPNLSLIFGYECVGVSSGTIVPVRGFWL